MGHHVVVQGEHLAAIAEKAGFRDAMTVWNAPENAALRKARDNPDVLAPGDVIYVPEKEPKTVPRSTDQFHPFVAKIDALKLRIVLLDFDNKPLANVPATLSVEGKSFELVSNGTGLIQQAIPRTAKTGRLLVKDLAIDLSLQIGHLDPVEEESGWRARLVNLGYYRGWVSDDGEVADKFFSWALEEFQCDTGLKVTGKPDAATLAKLKQAHGS
jgi:N-acetylmuramoyl-L-alanine amidase